MGVDYFENYNLKDVITPVNVDRLQELLMEANYDKSETKFLVNGFRHGFRIGYHGNRAVKLQSPNLKFRRVGKKMIGDKVTL